MREEKDFLGKEKVPKDALYGIHSLRAKNNFTYHLPFSLSWYKAMGKVKLSCYNTYSRLREVSLKEFNQNPPIAFFDEKIISSLEKAANDVANGKYFDQFIVSAIQGGAGTSINMNVNEIISNAALIHYGSVPGKYEIIDPILHANIYQSTNDVVPTALRVAVMEELKELENSVNRLRNQFEELEKKYRHTLRPGYTQLQEAVPSTFGLLFGGYANAFGRDWWRISKCFERIKVVNLGGSAIGTGITVPRFFVMEVVRELNKLTQLPLTRSENMCDATANLDPLVEVHGILKSLAVNLEKTAGDIRLLASDININRSLEIPPLQAGSSIMPGKVNPVISEYLISVAHHVYANDQIITSLSAQGQLDLNAYIPIIGHYLLASIAMMTDACNQFSDKVLAGIFIDEKTSEENLYSSPVIVTALVPYIGYYKAGEIAALMKQSNCNVFDANLKLNYIAPEKLIEILKPAELIKSGFSLKDL